MKMNRNSTLVRDSHLAPIPAIPGARKDSRTSELRALGAFAVFSLCNFTIVGCARPPFVYPAALNSERPDERVAAIRHATVIHDKSVIPILVDRLEDEDEAVRFYAILALERLTGTRLGYEYHAPEVQRSRAVARWRQYKNSSQPIDGPITGDAAREQPKP